jgi:hypothetical protein
MIVTIVIGKTWIAEVSLHLHYRLRPVSSRRSQGGPPIVRRQPKATAEYYDLRCIRIESTLLRAFEGYPKLTISTVATRKKCASTTYARTCRQRIWTTCARRKCFITASSIFSQGRCCRCFLCRWVGRTETSEPDRHAQLPRIWRARNRAGKIWRRRRLEEILQRRDSS